MSISLNFLLLWTFSVSLSAILSAFISNITMKNKYSIFVTILGYLTAYTIGFVISFLFYSINLSNDLGGTVIMSMLIWGTCILLSEGHWSAKLFVSIMSTLISNVSSFFVCGSILSFIDPDPNPYNIETVSELIVLEILLFIVIFIIYKARVLSIVCRVIETLHGKMEGYLPVALTSFFGFSVINVISNSMGIVPAAVTKNQIIKLMTLPDNIEIRYVFIGFYGIMSLIFVFQFWQMFSSVFWYSRAHKTEAELNVAKKVQQDMLPCIFPAFPNRIDFDIYATMEPVKEVGGDFYDFFLINRDTICLVIADVSDKGIPAALFMVITKTLIKNNVLLGKKPEEVFEIVNNILCEKNETGMFVTAFLGYLEISSRRFTYVNAGHNPPLLGTDGVGISERHFDWLPTKPGFVLAGMEDIIYQQVEITLQPGDELFLYTDGVTEAVDLEDKLFGSQLLLEVANKYLDLPLKKFITSVKWEIDRFSNGAEQSDDITMLSLRLLSHDMEGL